MHGVHEGKWELDSTRNELVIQAISSTVEADSPPHKLEIARKIPIMSTSRIWKYNPSRSRPIKIAFASKSDADLLMECKRKLQQGVYVDREYSEEEEHDRKTLRPILRAARKLPQYRGKCKLDGSKLVIKGKVYDKSNSDKLPEDVNVSSVSSKESDNVFGFFGELNPLSNFHPAKFVYNNIEYHSSEQLIQYQKAIQFGDKKIASEILSAKSALECK